MEVVFRKNTYNGPLVVETPGKYDLYTFDGSQSHEEWRWHPEVLANGQGFLYADSIPGMANRTLSLTGTLVPSNDALSFDLAYTNTPFGAWNLVGNPFACNATIDQPFYVIDGRNVVPNTGSTIIPPCTGVMLKADGTNQSVTFTKTIEQQSSQPNQLQITLSQAVSTRSSALMDKAIVSFNEGERLEKFVFNADNAMIYIPQGGKEYAIAFSDKAGEMPLNFKATENGTYTLTIDAEEVSLSYLHLIDKMTGEDIDLLALRQAQGPASYTFTAKTTDSASRFKLVFVSFCMDVDGDND